MRFHKYHALGNDYILMDPLETGLTLTPGLVRLLCDRNRGIGGDGILLGPNRRTAPFDLRIFNPDGSEAEKSGNGLRIFARYLRDTGLVGDDPFTVETRGGTVKAWILEDGRKVRIAMGQISFDGSLIPVRDEHGEVLNRSLEADGTTFQYSAATIGNPHCVIRMDEVSPGLARRFGPLIEKNPLFPNRTNVQFMKILDKSRIRIEIWERGAGYTLASGSSSVAAAGVARRTGFCGDHITVLMPGGEIEVELDDAYNALMSGSVTPVYEGKLKTGWSSGTHG